MDTKLKKTHKLTTIIITLCILIPAFFLTALYPKIGKEMQKKDVKYNEIHGEEGEFIWELQDNFVNFAMEASFHIYGEMLMEAGETNVNFAVLDYAGWTDDYDYLDEQVRYHATYQRDNETIGTANSAESLETMVDAVVALTIAFDAQGNISTLDIEVQNEDYVDFGSNQYLREQANKTFTQYQNNVAAYQSEYKSYIDANQLVPKNFTIEFIVDESSDFLWGYENYYYRSTEGLLFDVGAEWIILALGICVAFAALILPFFKKLDTGWEKLFCIPFEIIVALGIAAGFGFVGMFYAMGETCRLMDYPELTIIGTAIAENVQYGFLLALNFLGWVACFFVEYLVITSLRQLLCRPIYYLKHRLMIVIVLRWIKNGCVKLYKYVTAIDISGDMNKSILKIVGVNALVLEVGNLVLWVFTEARWYYFEFSILIIGVIGIGIYSIALYIALRHYGEKLQKQYNSVLNATNQMATGNLKISMEEDLGVLQPIGKSLERVQQGFKKAVVEEAKSQNMKTELITNVSHDLKTPLTAIITYVDLLKKDDITEDERRAYTDTLDKKSQRLKVLIEDLFEISKAHSGNVQMNFMNIDIVSLMKQVRSEMADQMDASNLTFRWGLPEEKIMLSLDGQRTYRVFENLLNNALKYAMPYSRVYVDILNLGTQVKVLFRNTSAEELDFEAERLTERFVRGDASRKSEGSGLGLAIAKSFVELQNGQFQIEVDGDLFKVTLTWDK